VWCLDWVCAVHDSQTAVLLLGGGAGGGTIVAAHAVRICERTHTLISLQHSFDPSIVSFHGPTLIKFHSSLLNAGVLLGHAGPLFCFNSKLPAIPKRPDFMRRCDRVRHRRRYPTIFARVDRAPGPRWTATPTAIASVATLRHVGAK
jgi:hypothetical protein